MVPPPDTAAPLLDWIGDAHLRIRLGDNISPECLNRVRSACERLRAAAIPGLRDITPAYTTLLLSFDPLMLDPDAAAATVRNLLSHLDTSHSPPPRTIEIPVCYHPIYAPDLADVAQRCSLTPEQVIALHSQPEYSVAFIGFDPGFPYLLGLPKQLNVPRLNAPRPRIPAGSVAIAGDQAGIYPHETPGGWRILGRTPLRLFDASADPPTLLAMGDRVRFIPVSIDRFHALESRP